MKKYIYPALMILCVAVFLISAGLLTDYLLNSKKQQNQYDDLANLVDQELNAIDQNNGSSNNTGNNDPDSPSSRPATYLTVTNPKTGESMRILRQYAIIYQMNYDLVGWIKIDGTNINYPVLQTPDSPNFYLTRDFYKNNSKYGAVYANETASTTVPSDNVTLYGHKMADGTMFASLHNYSDIAFYEANPYIRFDTIFEQHTYQILAIFKTTGNLEDSFNYHLFVDGDEESFNEYVRQCKELSLYETYVDAAYGDKLLTLSTCDHSIDDGRFVVVAKRIS